MLSGTRLLSDCRCSCIQRLVLAAHVGGKISHVVFLTGPRRFFIYAHARGCCLVTFLLEVNRGCNFGWQMRCVVLCRAAWCCLVVLVVVGGVSKREVSAHWRRYQLTPPRSSHESLRRLRRSAERRRSVLVVRARERGANVGVQVLRPSEWSLFLLQARQDSRPFCDIACSRKHDHLLVVLCCGQRWRLSLVLIVRHNIYLLRLNLQS